MYTQTDQSLRQKVEQLTTLSQISRELNATLDRDYVLKRVHQAVLHATRADCGTILLFDPAGSEDNPEEPVIGLQIGDPAKVALNELLKQVARSGESLIVSDFKADGHTGIEDAPKPEFSPPHEGIRSALMVPIAYQDKVVGLIDVHAHSPHAFDEAARQISETLAVQAAIGIGNALRYREQVLRSEQLNRRLDTLSRLHETSQILRNDTSLASALDSIAEAIRSATPFEVVLISVYEVEKNTLRRVSGAGLEANTLAELMAHEQPWPAIPGTCPSGTLFGAPSKCRSCPMSFTASRCRAMTMLPPKASAGIRMMFWWCLC